VGLAQMLHPQTIQRRIPRRRPVRAAFHYITEYIYEDVPFLTIFIFIFGAFPHSPVAGGARPLAVVGGRKGNFARRGHRPSVPSSSSLCSKGRVCVSHMTTPNENVPSKSQFRPFPVSVCSFSTKGVSFVRLFVLVTSGKAAKMMPLFLPPSLSRRASQFANFPGASNRARCLSQPLHLE